MKKLIFILPMLFAFVTAQGQGAMFLRGSQPAPTPGAGLLDSYKGSAFAMAPDVLLYSTYSALDDIAGSETFGQSGQWSVAILRDSDNAIRSFTPGQVADGTANTWVQAGVGGAANGFVRRGYDQSVTALDVSNLNHANQTTTASMPKLFDSSTGLILENGKAALHFDGVNDYMQAPNGTIGSVTNLFFIGVGQILNTGGGNYVFAGVSDGGYSNPDEWFAYQGFQNKFRSAVNEQGNQSTAFSSFSLNTNQFLASIQFLGGSQIDLSINNNISSTPTSITSLDLNQEVDFSAFDNSGSIVVPTETKQQCVLFWTTDQSTNRPGIETAINNEYNIY